MIVNELASDILGIGDHAAASKAFFDGGAILLGEAGQDNGVNGLGVLFLGLVLVRFKVRRESAFGNGLRGGFDGFLFAQKEGELLYGARLKVAKGGGRGLAEDGGG